MDEPISERARSLVARSTRGLRLWALARIALLLTTAKARAFKHSDRVPPEARAVAQRFGSQLWQRITTRFPGLDDLLSEVQPTTKPSVAPDPKPNVNPPVVVMPSVQGAPRASEPPQHTGDVPALLRALRDPSAEVAAAAATALGTVTDPKLELECQTALIGVLANADGYFNPLTRVAALQALVQKLRVPPTDLSLLPIVQAVRDVDAEVSMAAIVAVANHAPVDIVFEYLSPVVLDESGFYLPIVRAAATRAIERAELWNRPQQ